MSQEFTPGDFLVFQLESGYALLRLLAIDETQEGKVWHLAGYEDFFPDIESAEAAAAAGGLKMSAPHMAITTRAFESTQVARIGNTPLNGDDTEALDLWRTVPDPEVYDRSVRLLMGLR